MPNVRGTCAFAGCTKQQQKKSPNKWRATCGEHRGKVPHEDPKPTPRTKKRAQRELRQEIDARVGYRATSLRQHLKRL